MPWGWRPSTGGVKHSEGQAAHGCCWEPGVELLPSAHCSLVSVQGGAQDSLALGSGGIGDCVGCGSSACSTPSLLRGCSPGR